MGGDYPRSYERVLSLLFEEHESPQEVRNVVDYRPVVPFPSLGPHLIEGWC
jgi:hypothetical protein